MIAITGWVLVSHNGQFFGPFDTPEAAAKEITRCADMFAGPLLIQPLLALPQDHKPDGDQERG